MFRYDVITQTLRTSAGGKAAEKISVTYHFVISAMQAFVCSKFHAIIRENCFVMTSFLKLWELLPAVKQPKKFLSHTIS